MSRTSFHNFSYAAFAVFLIFLFLGHTQSNAQLTPTFYDQSCPRAQSVIKSFIGSAVSREPRMAASLIRLHFHDCFVQGCDGSVLLNDTPTFRGEQTVIQNLNSARGFEVIEGAKAEVDKICPGVVSCADVLAIAARDSSVARSGPTWQVKLGRRDSTTASFALANQNLPRFTASLTSLLALFRGFGLNERDMVALSGSHTVGQAQCATFRDRIYNSQSDIDPGFRSLRQSTCPQVGQDNVTAPLDLVTPNSFDNNYFKNLMAKKGLLQSDQVLFSGVSTDSIVREYSNNPTLFRSDFAAAMVKMGDIEPLTGQNGVIRRICSAPGAFTQRPTNVLLQKVNDILSLLNVV